MEETGKYEVEEIVTDTVDNGSIENVHIAPIGKFEGSDAEGNPVSETIDAESLSALAGRLNESGTEILADVDHKASKPGLERDTRSAGWFSKFVVDPIKGLFATLRLTRHGKDLLENREYRYISPSFTLGEDGRPVELHTASLTNTPAFAGWISPILNSRPKDLGTDMTKEELKELVKETLAELKAEGEKAEAAEEAKEEKTEEKIEEKTEEVVDEKPETSEKKTETACNEDPAKTEETEKAEEEKKEEEVIKIEALNSAPAASLSAPKWQNMGREEFIKWFNAGNR